MKQGRFSLATLLLMMAMAAVSFAVVRSAVTRDLQGIDAVIGWGAAGGCLLGIALSYWDGGGGLLALGRIAAGTCLGMAAAAQCTRQVNWPVICTAPWILVACAGLVAWNSRRRGHASSPRPQETPPVRT